MKRPPNRPAAFATVSALLRDRAENSPDLRAYTFLDAAGDESAALTFAELDAGARAIAARLQALGAGGARALLLYPPGLDFVVAFLGCLHAGVVAVPAYPPRSPRTLPRLLAIAEDSQPRFALTESSLVPQLAALALAETAAAWQGIELLATDGILPSLAAEWRDPGTTAESLAFLQYTSGLTAAPKGVMVTHGNLLHNEEMIRRAFGRRSSGGARWGASGRWRAA